MQLLDWSVSAGAVILYPISYMLYPISYIL